MTDGLRTSLGITSSAGSYAFNQEVQAYNFVSSAGSVATVVFKNPYNVKPAALASAAGGVANVVWGTGSATVSTTAASSSGAVFVFGN